MISIVPVVAWVTLALFAFFVIAGAERITLWSHRKYTSAAVRYVFTFVVAYITVSVYAKLVLNLSTEQIGLKPNAGSVMQFFLGTAVGTGLAVTVTLIMWFSGGITIRRLVGGHRGAGRWLLITSVLSFLQAATEEIFLRTSLLKQLILTMDQDMACWLWGITFGAIHLLNRRYTPLAVLSTAFAGVMLSYVFVRTGSVWTSIGIHGAWNFIVFQVVMSGRVIAVTYSPSILRGRGHGGLEGSLASVFVLAGAALWITFNDFS
ncbi:hypothetical protein MNBD_GAMMA13-1332 [hydrothermal vent metagenome]|uniref:CAAX prenyl protease 2/Lysostaphin resistance protein A-like domain-containing protein n=1 Tax=hydrothermal vent metagenome TaxID=652676 RepID=A0A3B0Z440_9ZZZZ